jgi:hypothetical protein
MSSEADDEKRKDQVEKRRLQVELVNKIPVASKDFHLKEYESLKKEVAEQVEHTRKLEIYAVGGIAAFYSWFINNNPPPALLIIPLLLALLGAWRSGAALKRIEEIVVYLVRLEDEFALFGFGWETHRKAGLGWETYHKDKKNNPSSPFLLSGAAFWGTLVLATGAAWWVVSR